MGTDHGDGSPVPVRGPGREPKGGDGSGVIALPRLTDSLCISSDIPRSDFSRSDFLLEKHLRFAIQ